MRFFSIIAALLFSCFSYGTPVDMSDPNHVIHSVSTNTLARITAEKERLENEPDYINVVIEEELIPYFDYKYAAFKVMGRYLNSTKTTEEQRSNFVDAFKNYLVNAYGHILFEYDQHKLKILDNPHFKGKQIISIVVKVYDANGQETEIAFKLRKNKKTGQWKVFDVIAEGISMLSTKRSELGELLQKNGIDQVVDMLNEKNSEFSS
jgi:phospholipid transport system substrate-binding protein